MMLVRIRNYGAGLFSQGRREAESRFGTAMDRYDEFPARIRRIRIRKYDKYRKG